MKDARSARVFIPGSFGCAHDDELLKGAASGRVFTSGCFGFAQDDELLKGAPSARVFTSDCFCLVSAGCFGCFWRQREWEFNVADASGGYVADCETYPCGGYGNVELLVGAVVFPIHFVG